MFLLIVLHHHTSKGCAKSDFTLKVPQILCKLCHNDTHIVPKSVTQAMCAIDFQRADTVLETGRNAAKSSMVMISIDSGISRKL